MPRRGLDRAAVVEAAVALADAESVEGVTFARLAERLGVRGPSLYNHLPGLDGLRRELAVRGLRELARLLGRAAIGRSGDAALVALADAYRDFARAHPGLYAAAQRAPDPADPEWNALSAEVVGIVVAVLAGYGLAGDDAVHALRGLRSLMHGFVSLETGGGFGLPLDIDESYSRLVRAFAAGLRPERGDPGEPSPPRRSRAPRR
ncbi:MAG TPA: TetR-like C-terminal domain-containing protein [Chloroflexota bacterium]